MFGIYSELNELTVRDINEMIKEDNVNFPYEKCLFPEYYPDAYDFLKSE